MGDHTFLNKVNIATPVVLPIIQLKQHTIDQSQVTGGKESYGCNYTNFLKTI